MSRSTGLAAAKPQDEGAVAEAIATVSRGSTRLRLVGRPLVCDLLVLARAAEAAAEELLGSTSLVTTATGGAVVLQMPARARPAAPEQAAAGP